MLNNIQFTGNKYDQSTLNQKVLLDYIPHGIDDKVFKLISIDEPGNTIKRKTKDGKELEMTEFEDMLDFKKKVFHGQEYDFVILFNSRNIRRKMPGDIILAYQKFWEMLPEDKQDKVVLLMHTNVVDENGTDLIAVKKSVAPKAHIIFSNDKLEIRLMNFLYNVSDVTINMASNEGYGLSTAESLMTETPIIVNVTGGLQDQCGFVDENNKFLDPDEHFNEKWGSNHDAKYKKHGSWVKPLFPTNRALVGSPRTPYIFDDRCDWLDAANALKYWYDIGDVERRKFGKIGRKFMQDTGMTAKKMGSRFINYIDNSINNFKPKKRFTIYEM